MKKTFTLIAALCVATSAWAADIVLDLSNPVIPETLNFGENEFINETYDETYEWFEFPPFLLSHIHGEGSSWGGAYWDGFTVCKSDYNATGGLEHQWSNIAGGGMNADGSVNPEQPYLLCYWGDFYGPEGAKVMFDDGNTYFVKGMYVNNTAYSYYCCADENSIGRPLNQEGDYFKLIAHGVDETGAETSTAEIELCGFHNGQFSGITDWTWFDMSALGQVSEIFFTMDSSDKGEWGINTPTYFVMDKLTVSTSIATAVNDVDVNKQVAGVKYVNMAGIESSKPFDGVNIVVTTYTDGTKASTKVIK